MYLILPWLLVKRKRFVYPSSSCKSHAVAAYPMSYLRSPYRFCTRCRTHYACADDSQMSHCYRYPPAFQKSYYVIILQDLLF